jgi:hypothetical protein
MKMRKIPYSKKSVHLMIASSFFMVLSVALGFNCQRMKPYQSQSSMGETNVAVEPPLGVGFMSSDQMVKAMIAATGTEGFGELTDSADDLIDRTYNDKTGMLPSVTNLHQATGPTLIAVTNLASTICAKAVDRDRAVGEAQKVNRLFFREMDFSKGLSGQSSDAVTSAFERLARNAWRHDANDQDLSDILSFAQEFSSGADGADPQQTRMLAISVCTAALSSIEALTY